MLPKKGHSPFLFFILASLSILFFLIGFPITYILINSFTLIDLKDLSYTYVGLQNFIRVFSDESFYLTLENTLIWTFVATLGSVSLGLLTALILNENIAFKRLFGSLLFIPYAIGYVEAAYMWLWFTNPVYGIFNNFLYTIGLINDPRLSLFQSRWSALFTVMLVQIWKHFPFMSIILRAGLQNIRRELYEAADIDGAGSIRKFYNITIPLLKPSIALGSLLTLVHNFNSFTLVWVMTQGGPYGQTHIFATYIYQTAFLYLDLGKFMALSDVVFIVIFAITIIYLRIVKY